MAKTDRIIKCEKCYALKEKGKGNCPSHRRKKNAGRKMFDGKIEKTIVAKLKEAFGSGVSMRKACSYAKITKDQLQRYLAKHPQFRDEIELLQTKPSMLAETNIVSAMQEKKADGKPTKEAIDNSWRYLERKDPDFMPQSKQKIDMAQKRELTPEGAKLAEKALKLFKSLSATEIKITQQAK